MNILIRALIFCFISGLFFACGNNSAKVKTEAAADVKLAWEIEQRGVAFQSKGMSDSAFHYFTKAKNLYEKASDSARVVYVLFRIADLHWQFSDYSEMQATTVEALKFLDAGSRSAYEPVIRNNFGIAYCNLEDYPRAIANYNLVLKSSEHPVHRLTARNNIAYVHMNSGDFNKAYEILKQLVESPNLKDSTALEARIKDNLGFSAFKTSKSGYMDLLLDGLKLRRDIGDEYGEITSCLHIADAFVNTDRTRAIDFAKRAETLSADIGSAEDQLLALKFLSAYDNPMRANIYSANYFRISDSLQTARRKARNQFAEIRYNYKSEREQKLRSQAKAARLELEKAELEKVRLWWALAAICVITISIFVIASMIRRHRRNRLKTAYDTEVRISKRLHDELANDLHQTMVFTETNDMSHQKNADKLVENLDLLYKRARSISRENAAIDVSGDFSTAIRTLISSYISAEQTVLPVGIDDVQWQLLHDETKVVIYRSVQEMLVNMRKHSKSSKAVLRFDTNKGLLRINYSDNGIGCPVGGISKNGLSIMENRISALKGTVTFETDSGKGFRAAIEFPL